MTTPLLDEKILLLTRCLTAAGIPHAFGGALALAYYGTPRGTQDIDVNVFVETAEAERVIEQLAPLGVDSGTPSERARLAREGQIRLYWEHTPLDLFFSYDALHDRCLARKRRVSFGGDDEIDVLSAEDLVVFKVLFDRAKDWDDIAEVLYAQGPEFDADYALEWLRAILPREDERLTRFEAALRGDPAQEGRA